MKTKFRLVKTDVTHQWNKDFLRANNVEKCIDYCLVNLNMTTNLCEITPSYELYPYYSEFITKDNGEIPDAVLDELMENNTLDDYYYVHCGSVDLKNARPFSSNNFSYPDGNDLIYYSKLEKVMENLKCNVITW